MAVNKRRALIAKTSSHANHRSRKDRTDFIPSDEAHIRTVTRSAFSLVELSIVLVILGLLVGGVLSGQSLIRASELRAVTKEFDNYRTAMGSFRDKYFGLPGDLSNAGAIWIIPVVPSPLGDGKITNVAAGGNEISLFWFELSKATLIEGSYTLIAGTTFTPGTNNPKSKLGNAGWNIAYLGTIAVDGTNGGLSGTTSPAASTFFANSYGHVLLFGGGTNALLPGPLLRPEEAWNIDTKIDDGKPDLGAVTTLESQGAAAGTGCSDQDTATTALAASSYSLTNTSQLCSLVFKTGY